MTAAAAAARFEHEALLYRDDEDFLAVVVPFLCEGLALDEAVVVLEPGPRLEMVRDALGADAAAVRFADVTDVGANPGRLLPLFGEAFAEAAASGRRLRGLGEPLFPARRAAELAECEVHETLVNVAFGPGTPGRLMCAYDARLPGGVHSSVLRTHPWYRDAGGRQASTTHVPPHDGLDLAALPADPALAPPTDVVLRGEFGRGDVPAVRRTVRQYARSCGLSDDRVADLELAASELASNCVRHGGGSGSVALWREPNAVLLEFTCPERMTDALAGRRRPDPGAEGGMGLYLVHHVCDLVQVRTGPWGTTVRVSTWAQAA